MGRKVLVECDGCGKEELEQNITDWIDATFKVGKKGNEDGIFCSFECVARYSHRRERQMSPTA